MRKFLFHINYTDSDKEDLFLWEVKKNFYVYGLSHSDYDLGAPTVYCSVNFKYFQYLIFLGKIQYLYNIVISILMIG